MTSQPGSFTFGRREDGWLVIGRLRRATAGAVVTEIDIEELYQRFPCGPGAGELVLRDGQRLAFDSVQRDSAKLTIAVSVDPAQLAGGRVELQIRALDTSR